MLTRSPQLVVILSLVFVATLSVNSLVLRADELPPDLKKVVETFEKETVGIRKKGDDRTSAAQDKLLKKLRELQIDQTKAGLLDEAVLIRDSVRAVEADKKAARLSKFASNAVAKLPIEAQISIREYDESISSISQEVADDLTNKRAAYNTRLKELLAAYTKEGKLDAALAIRSRISSSPEIVPTTTGNAAAGTSTGLGEAGTDFATVERRVREISSSRQMENSKAHKQVADGLVLKLADAQATHTKAGRLDPAVAIRDFSQRLAKEQDPYKMVELARNVRPNLPTDAAALVGDFLEETAKLQITSAENLAKLNAEYAPHVEVEVRKQLIAGDLEASRRLLTLLSSLRKKDFPFSHAGWYRQIPMLSAQAQPLFDRFAETKADRLAKANAELEPLRKKLIETLQKALEAKPNEDATDALEQTIKTLESESSEGLRGMVLFVADKRLPEASAAAVKEVRTTVKKLFQELNSQNADTAKKFTADLVPVREAHTVAGEYEAAFVMLERQQNAHRSFDPIRVKTSTAAGHPLTWDGTVIDAKDGLYLVNQTHREEWLTRDRFRVGNESPAVNVQLGGSSDPRSPVRPNPFGTPKEGPGQPVTEKTKLKQGQRLMAYWGSRWLPVTVIESSAAGVKIHWEGYPNSSVEVVERSRLRDVSDD